MTDYFSQLLQKTQQRNMRILDEFEPDWKKIYQVNDFARPQELEEQEVQQIPPPGCSPLSPVTFDSLDMPQTLRQNATRLHLTSLSPVQRYSFPAFASGNDVIMIAPTGSGKTFAFLFPLLGQILEKDLKRAVGTPCEYQNKQTPAPAHPLAVVISPTRQLALQTLQEFFKASAGTGVLGRAMVGAPSINEQLSLLKQGCDVVFCTVNALRDAVELNALYLDQCRFLVVDEADRCV